MAMKVAHLSSVHTRHDTRIFLKMCRSAAAAGYEVALVVADGLGDEHRDGVAIVDIGRFKGRVVRMVGATRLVLKRGLDLDADLYHIHDPELLPVGLALKRRGKRVIFDSHEDVPLQILSKVYLHPVFRRPVSLAMAAFERYACRSLDAVIAATPTIRDKFVGMAIPAIDINNFPILGELNVEVPWGDKATEVCYVGGITADRGIREVVTAMQAVRSGARLNLGGRFSDRASRAEVEGTNGWGRVNELGFLAREQVRDVLGRSVAGIVTLRPTPAYLDSLPVKMFEYMAAGLPVIASNFPLWRQIIESSECGICVDPLNPAAIAAAIDRLVENPELARRMGENGRRAVHERYNWGMEEKKLMALYSGLLSRNGAARI